MMTLMIDAFNNNNSFITHALYCINSNAKKIRT